MRINIFTLGCSKNRVDSEVLMRQLKANGFSVAHQSPENNFSIVIINTCGFIGDAKEESIETILNFAEAKNQGIITKLIVFGCLSERYKEQLITEIPEVDAWFGKFELQKMLQFLGKDKKEVSPFRILTTPTHYAYLKISEGCNRTCSFCAIPQITKKHKSVPVEILIKQAQELIKQGVKEIILIAQDLSFYGRDLYKKPMLANLMEQLAQLKGVYWLRIHYTYPAHFPLDILPIMAKYKNICKYMDIALQHISDNMLKNMRRNISKQQTYNLLATFRAEVPDIALRTTLLVGHPNETQADFEELKQFVHNIAFDRLGVFAYSHEEGTYAHKNYEDNVSEEIKQNRLNEIMDIQSRISLNKNRQKIGKILPVLIDSLENNYYIGRTQSDSPEVDGEVLINSKKPLLIGNFYDIKISDANEYDLIGIPNS